jgi:hypothetical protein
MENLRRLHFFQLMLISFDTIIIHLNFYVGINYRSRKFLFSGMNSIVFFDILNIPCYQFNENESIYGDRCSK